MAAAVELVGMYPNIELIRASPRDIVPVPSAFGRALGGLR